MNFIKFLKEHHNQYDFLENTSKMVESRKFMVILLFHTPTAKNHRRVMRFLENMCFLKKHHNQYDIFLENKYILKKYHN